MLNLEGKTFHLYTWTLDKAPAFRLRASDVICGIHRSPGRQQLLHHGAVAVVHRNLQRRPSSAGNGFFDIKRVVTFLVSRRRAGPAGIEFNHAMASRQKLTYCTGSEHRWAQCRQKLSSQLLATGRKKGLIPSIFPWPRESIHLAHLGTSS